MLLSCHDALPNTTAFLVERTDRTGNSAAVASLTLIPDSSLGLALDEFEHVGLHRLRTAGRRPVELAKLATVAATERTTANGPAPRELILLHLFKLAYLTARYLEQATDLVIAVAPHQERYFRRVLLFEDLNAGPPIEGAEKRLAVPLRLGLDTAEERFESKYARHSGRNNLFQFFVNAGNAGILDWLRASRRPLSPADARYLFAERSQLLQKIDEATRRMILNLYPGMSI